MPGGCGPGSSVRMTTHLCSKGCCCPGGLPAQRRCPAQSECGQVGTHRMGSSLFCWLQHSCVSVLGSPSHGFSDFKMGRKTLFPNTGICLWKWICELDLAPTWVQRDQSQWKLRGWVRPKSWTVSKWLYNTVDSSSVSTVQNLRYSGR